MTRRYDGEDPVSAPEAHDAPAGGGIAGYDAWKTATPPEYSQDVTPPARTRSLPEGACGRQTWPFVCTKPYGHLGTGSGGLCNHGEGR